MSATRTDDDLERLLRATLTAHARAVDYGPPWDPPADAVTSHDRSRAYRWRMAAAVAAVLVLGLVATLAIVHVRRHARPTPPAGPPSSAFTTFDVPGFTVTSRETLGDGARSVTVRAPHGAGYVAVTLWAPHKYRFSRLGHQRVVQVSGHRGYAGSDGTEQFRNHDRPIRAVVWQFAPDQWAVAQQVGNTSRVPGPATILAAARAARPDQHLPLTTPFRLDALPARYTLDQVIISPNVVFLLLHAGSNRSLELVAEPRKQGGSVTEPGAVVYRDSDTKVTIFAIGPSGRPQRKDRALAREAGRHIVWGTTDLSRIVP